MEAMKKINKSIQEKLKTKPMRYGFNGSKIVPDVTGIALTIDKNSEKLFEEDIKNLLAAYNENQTNILLQL
jgi:hypothetical protein